MIRRTLSFCLLAALIPAATAGSTPAPVQAHGSAESLGGFNAARPLDFDGTGAGGGLSWSGLRASVKAFVGTAANEKTVTLFTLDNMVTRRMPNSVFATVAFKGTAVRYTDAVTALEYTFDPDVPAEIQAQMRDDLAFIGAIRGAAASGLHRKIFGPVDGPTYARFFESRVTGVGLSDCGSANAVACVMPFFDPSKMWLTQNYIKFHHPQIARLMVVFHESRHTESSNGNWPHANCPDPFHDENGQEMHSIWTGAALAGEPACDRTPFGSYGSSLILLKNVQKFCSNCTDKVRMDAGLYADDQFKRITDPGAQKAIRADLY